MAIYATCKCGYKYNVKKSLNMKKEDYIFYPYCPYCGSKKKYYIEVELSEYNKWENKN